MHDAPAAATSTLPLGGHPGFCAHTREELCRAVEQQLAARVVQLPRAPEGRSSGHRFRLANSELWSCSYAGATRLRFAAGDYLRVQFPRSGSGRTSTQGCSVPVTGAQGCISASEAEIDFGPGFQQLAWRIARRELVRKWSLLTGLPCTRELDFDPALDLSTPGATALLSVLSSLLTCIDTLPATGRSLLTTELEEGLVVALLVGTPHSLRHLLDRPAARAAPWQVRRIEEHIAAHCDRPITMEELVALTGCSARSIFRAFRENRGYTPKEFLMQRRLERARVQLADPASRLGVTEVALSCGFTSLSHFSKAFSVAYGEPPSALIRRRR